MKKRILKRITNGPPSNLAKGEHKEGGWGEQNDAGEVPHRPPLTTKEAAKYTGLRANQLEKLRCSGGGPTFLKIIGSIRYRPDDLDTWLASFARRSTSDDGDQQ